MDEVNFKMLLVEDDELDQIAFKRLIEREKLHYDCTIADSLAQAREILAKNEFEVIIADYSLGDGTALDVLAMSGQTPVIIVTGADDKETAVKAWRAGAYDFLTKDVDREYLKTIQITIENAIKQAELKRLLERKQKNLHAIFDAAPVGMLLVDENMLITRVNQAISNLVGKDFPQIVGQLPGNALGCKTVASCNGGVCGKQENCQKCMFRTSVRTAIESGKSIHEIEIHPVFLRNGREVSPWLSINVEPIMIDGAHCAVIAVNDITSRKESEAAIQASEERYRMIFEQAADAIWMVDSDNLKIVEFNGKAHNNLGYTKEEFSQLAIEDIFESQSKDTIQSYIQKALEQGSAIFETRLRKKDSEIRDVQANCNTVRIRGRKLIQIVVNDITERKRTEQKLRETMELKAQFISTVSHELRTPLTCIKEAVEVVLDGLAGQVNDKQRQFLDIVKRNIDRLSMLINDVLDFQRLESGRSKIDIRENDISEISRSINETLGIAARQNGLNFVVELDRKLPKVWCDSNKIIQVMTNLVSNAIKFTPQGGSVIVSFLRQNDEVIMRVRDTGMGIPKESLPKIFERFYRVPRPGKEIKGTGLGLSIVRKIVDLHRGRIEVESELEKGTTFIITIPFDCRASVENLKESSDVMVESALVESSAKK